MHVDREYIIGHPARPRVLDTNMAMGWDGLNAGCKTSYSTCAFASVKNSPQWHSVAAVLVQGSGKSMREAGC
jgi:hypothetical protein